MPAKKPYASRTLSTLPTPYWASRSCLARNQSGACTAFWIKLMASWLPDVMQTRARKSCNAMAQFQCGHQVSGAGDLNCTLALADLNLACAIPDVQCQLMGLGGPPPSENSAWDLNTAANALLISHSVELGQHKLRVIGL